MKITQQPDKEGNKKADCRHTTSIKRGRVGDEEGTRGEKKEGYKILIRQPICLSGFLYLFFFFLVVSLPFCCSRAPPQRPEQTIFIAPN